MPARNVVYDWVEIQAAYDTGLSMRNLVSRFGCAYLTIQRAKADGLFIPRGKNERVMARDVNPSIYEKEPKNIWVIVEGPIHWPCERCGAQRPRLETRYCSFLCSTQHPTESYISRWLIGLESGSGANGSLLRTVRKYVIADMNSTCEWPGCGFCEVNPFTKLPIVQVDHRDGRYDNNSRENLRVLCPNHHAMTETFGKLNQGNGRHYRRLDYERQQREIRAFKARPRRYDYSAFNA